MMRPGRNQKHRLFHHLFYVLILAASLIFCAPVLGSGEGEAHGDAHAKGWVKTDTFRVINFALLAIGLFYILRKPAAQALNSRITGIKEQLSDLEARKEAAEKELAHYNEKLALLDKEAEKIVEDYIQQGNEAKARILKEAESAAEKLEEKAKRNIEHEFKQAKLQLQAEIIDQALVEAEKKIIEKITSEDQDRLVDEYLEKVVA